MSRLRSYSIVAVLVLALCTLSVVADESVLRFGLIADLHAHDIDSPLEGKWMSHTEERLQAFVDAMNAWSPDFIIELGDFVNGWVVLGTEPGDPSRIPDILAWTESLYRQFEGPAYHVIGNHDVYNLDKAQYREILGIDATSYAFDAGLYHFIVLDVQYALDGSDHAHTYTGVSGNVPDDLLEWLAADLASSERPTLIFVHQMLDDFIEAWGRPTVFNQEALQELFVQDGDVIAVLQGHAHDNVHRVLDGIHYITFEAMVDHGTPPTWAQITLSPETQTLYIEGVGVQASYELLYSHDPTSP